MVRKIEEKNINILPADLIEDITLFEKSYE